ncbi:MAG: flippase-like domain-containing protein [Bacteroidales bacterium]|nr:flippase-like domain-containing protein [Bacteroidales bacterium]
MPREKSNRESKKTKKIKWFSLLRILGITIFIIVLFNVDLAAIWEHIKKVNLLFLLVAIFFQIILLLVKGYRWHILNNGSKNKASIFQSLGEFFESYAMGVITPGRIGELMKAGYQNKKEKVIASGVRVLAERGLDIGFFIIIAACALIWANLIIISPLLSFLILLGGVIIFIVAILLIGSKKIYTWIDKLVKNISGSFKFRTKKEILIIVILALVSNLSYFISCYFLALGIDLPISFLTVSGGVAIAGLLNMLPITVMGLGTRELTFLYVFKAFSEVQVLALSGLIFLVAQIGGGIIALILGQIFLNLKTPKNEPVN